MRMLHEYFTIISGNRKLSLNQPRSASPYFICGRVLPHILKVKVFPQRLAIVSCHSCYILLLSKIKMKLLLTSLLNILLTFSALASDSAVVCNKIGELLEVGPLSTESTISLAGRSRNRQACQIRATVRDEFCELSILSRTRRSSGAHFSISGIESWRFSRIDMTEGLVAINAFRRDGDLNISGDGLSGSLEQESMKISTHQNKFKLVYAASSGMIFRRTRSVNCEAELP